MSIARCYKKCPVCIRLAPNTHARQRFSAPLSTRCPVLWAVREAAPTQLPTVSWDLEPQHLPSKPDSHCPGCALPSKLGTLIRHVLWSANTWELKGGMIDPTVQCPGTEGIHAAYKQGDPSRARHLLREACDESTSQLEKVGSCRPLWPKLGTWVGQRLPLRLFSCYHHNHSGDFLLCSGNTSFYM